MHAPQPLIALLLAAVAFVASTLAAVTGFGGAAVLLPVLAAVFGVREAIPILTVAQLIGNGSRVWFNRREVDWRVVGWFAVGAVPFAFAGGFLFARAPLSALTLPWPWIATASGLIITSSRTLLGTLSIT